MTDKNLFLIENQPGYHRGKSEDEPLKWVAYGSKDMGYFALKIMQKCGYLNSKYALAAIYDLHP